ncbi:hypothetical protein DFQ08_102745 [Winogradskyella arenosi]|uniref:Uncharacterized protein n=1 Tax=Winogradskyella arenosi TaxID=533325 RepID=A0A368ZGZ8_9FLAO|nr:hypothetical protein DFQ08_102745 [Winogradskyella arenosi]
MNSLKRSELFFYCYKNNTFDTYNEHTKPHNTKFINADDARVYVYVRYF